MGLLNLERIGMGIVIACLSVGAFSIAFVLCVAWRKLAERRRARRDRETFVRIWEPDRADAG